jgi:hypothetical protein
MATSPVRVPESVHAEIGAAARLFGCNAAELLEQAWNSFRQSPQFVHDFEMAQKAFSAGDLDRVASRLTEQAEHRALARAQAVAQLRESI